MRSKIRVFFVLFLCLPAFSQYQEAMPGYHFQFPRDHFDHPNFQTEWWYYTGNLRSSDGHRFGFELTFFREGVNRNSKTNESAWGIRDLYIAHFALSDITGKQFLEQERINRAGPGLAGISERDNRIWNGNWQVAWNADRQQLSAVGDAFRISLSTRTAKQPIIHGLDGISQKAAGPGHASHYISFTRLLTAGTLSLNGTQFNVDGSSWMDHEFFTNQLSPDEAGWDWLSLQLSDNTELMLYRLRHKDGSIDPFSSGTYVDAQGRAVHLTESDFSMKPGTELWASPETKANYPISWRVSVPKLQIDLNITTPLHSQEIVSRRKRTPSYWEGAIDLAGRRGVQPLSGVGYLEMTGYAGSVQF